MPDKERQGMSGICKVHGVYCNHSREVSGHGMDGGYPGGG